MYPAHVQSFSTTPQVMLAASYWSLLAPAIELANESRMYGSLTFVPIAIGFTAGAVFVYLADLLLPLLVRRTRIKKECSCVVYVTFHSPRVCTHLIGRLPSMGWSQRRGGGLSP